MVALIDTLEEKQLVKRHRDPSNRRAYILEVTAVGRKRLRNARNAVELAEQETLAPLSAAESVALTHALQRVVQTGAIDSSGARPKNGNSSLLIKATLTLHCFRSRKTGLNDASPGCVTSLHERPEGLSDLSRLNRRWGRCRRSLYGSRNHDLTHVDVKFAQTLGEDAH